MGGLTRATGLKTTQPSRKNSTNLVAIHPLRAALPSVQPLESYAHLQIEEERSMTIAVHPGNHFQIDRDCPSSAMSFDPDYVEPQAMLKNMFEHAAAAAP